MLVNVNCYTLQWMILICIICPNGIDCSLRQSVLNKECVTPDGHEGACLKLITCPVVSELLKRRKEPGIESFLRKSHCGFEGRDVVICCPKKRTKIPQSPMVLQSLNTTTILSTFMPATQPLKVSIQTHTWITTPHTPSSTVQTQKSSSAMPEIFSTTVSSAQGTRLKTPDELHLSPHVVNLCGISNTTKTKIVGGQDADLGSWPWITAIGYPEKDGNISYRCGGTLITDKHVLTAAHCIVFGGSRPTEVRLGDLNLDSNVRDGAYPIDMKIENIIIHENFKYPKVQNDIAILILNGSVTFNKLIRPICLPTPAPMKRTTTFQHKDLYIIGWGTTFYGKRTISAMLHEARVPVYNDDKCKNTYQNTVNAVIDDRVICAGGNGKDACQGDSGGPLIAIYSSTAYLVGIVSHGSGCGNSQYPGVYTRVSNFLNWIFTHVETFRNCTNKPETCAIRPTKTHQINYGTMPCGQSNQTIDDVIDGQDSKPGSHPWIVAVGFDLVDTTYRCTGVLISDRHVLSSATCIQGYEFRLTEVRLGALEVGIAGEGLDSEELAKVTDVPVEGIIVHENYREFPRENDIGIIALKTPVQFTDRVRPICLPMGANLGSKDFQNKTFLTAGWGLWEDDETRGTAPLREAKYHSYERNKCRKAYEDDTEVVIDERVICAGKNDNSTCHVDEGGPLITKENEKFYLVGMVSYGAELCGHPNKPNIHTNISYFLDWIIENTRY